MKKAVILLSVMALGVGLLAGCGSVDVATNTIIIDSKGKVTEALVEDFSKDYYSQDELKAFVEEEIAEYEETHDKGDVKLSDLSVEAGTAKMVMTYADAATYQEFHDGTFYVGSVVNAQTAGYDFGVNFYAVTDGALASTYTGTSTVVAEEGNVVILQDAIEVQVPGTITYVSEGVTIASSNTAAIVTENETDVAPVAYIIYK